MPSSTASTKHPAEAEHQTQTPVQQQPSQSASQRPASRIVGAFEVTQTKLGTGQFAKVYLGYHVKERYKVAVKAVDLRIVQKPYAEVKELSRLQRERTHPNIVRLYDTHQNDKFLCAFLEYCEGGDLHHRMEKLRHLQRATIKAAAAAAATGQQGGDAEGGAKSGGGGGQLLVDEYTVQRIGTQLLDGLCFLNENHIMHRDLKPANILLTHKDIHKADIRIADLGFARAGSESSMMMESCIGTAFYMAPERLRSDRYDFQAEVWAAGLILYELLYGKHPFPARGFMELAHMTETQAVVFPETTVVVSDSFKDLMRKMIVADPSKRITIGAARSHPWFLEALDAPPVQQAEGEEDAGAEVKKTGAEEGGADSAVATTSSSEQQQQLHKVSSPNIAGGDLGSTSGDDEEGIGSNGDDEEVAGQHHDVAASTRADAGTSPLRATGHAASYQRGRDQAPRQVPSTHVDPSSFSVALMHDEPPAVQTLPPPPLALSATAPTTRLTGSNLAATSLSGGGGPGGSSAAGNTVSFSTAAGDHPRQQRYLPHTTTGTSPPMVFGHAPNSSFVEACSLPLSNHSIGGGYRNNSSLAGSAGTVGSFGSRTHGSGGGGPGTSPLPTSSFAHHQQQANAVPLYNFMQGRPMLDMARIVAWAARENPIAANRAQLYHYAALVATSFEFSAHCSSEIADFRDECVALGARHGATAIASANGSGVGGSSPCAQPGDCRGEGNTKKASKHKTSKRTFEDTEHKRDSPPQEAVAVRTPPPHVLALQTAIDWMHVVHDPTIAQHFTVAEIDAIFKGAATLCEVVRDDPNAGESGTSADAGHMKELILARWDRVREGLRDVGGHCGSRAAALSIA